MDESKNAGGGDFYDRVFSRATGVVFQSYSRESRRAKRHGSHSQRRIMVSTGAGIDPTLNQGGNIIGYTAGNDMSARDIEGENPLFTLQSSDQIQITIDPIGTLVNEVAPIS